MQWKFESLVCFDLETTGLPQYGPVKITEFAFVGVVRSHIKDEYITHLTLPRVSHKLSFTVYPKKTISFEASNITGLWNDLLQDIRPWDLQSFEMLLAFLNLLPPPVCLVAHNGYKFDFPIFKQHIAKINQALPGNIIFVDSWPAFQKILGEDVKKLEEADQKSSLLIKNSIQDMSLGNDLLIKVAGESESSLVGGFATKHPEVTPGRKDVLNSPNLCVEQRSNINSNSHVPSSSKSKVRRCLFPRKFPVSYKLSDIYSHLFDEDYDAHTAEGDAVTLLKCILKVAPNFLEYANENHKTFNNI